MHPWHWRRLFLGSRSFDTGLIPPLCSVPNVTIISEGTTGSGGDGNGGSSQGKSKSNVGPIVGGVVGGVGGFILLSLLGFYFWRRSRRQRNDDEMVNVYSNRPITQPVPYNYAREETLPWNTTGSVQPQGSQPQLETSPASSGVVGYGVGVGAGLGSGRPSKSREALITTQYSAPTSQAAGSSYAASSGPSSSQEAPSGSDLNVGSPVSPSEVAGLRVEVENLRRVMQQFAMEPPPTYHEGD